jgi:hypothetical protein
MGSAIGRGVRVECVPLGKLLSFTVAIFVIAAALAIWPRVIDEGSGHAMTIALAGGIFTIALAVYIRE